MPARASFLLAALVGADLPVHCLRHQVTGEWDFFLGDAGPQRTSCGHRRPDNADVEPNLEELSSTKKLRVSLEDGARATVTDDGGISLLAMDSGMNMWTMIYDEGFEVRVNDLTLFSFSKFDLFERDGQKVNVSHCGETMVGWYHNGDRSQWGCFRGKKVTTETALASFVPAMPTKSMAYDLPLDLDFHQNVADRLNMLQTSWSASTSWLRAQKYQGKSPRELNKLMGIRRSHPISAMQAQQKVKKPTSFLSERATTASLKAARYDEKLAAHEASMSDTFDWRNVDGKNYLEPVMDQGDCGSCYVVASMRMLTARNKLRSSNLDADPFSISFPLYCAEYNQGCDGGYAFLTTKWSEDVGLLPAKCARYTTGGQCSATCQDGEKLRAANHRYIGGYYGASSAVEMMDELVNNGPLVVSLEPKSDLMYYSGGVYESIPDEIHQEWERVDHAVLLVGYGEENGKKYWTLQNSWGPDWGESGFFRMSRGINDSGVESIAVAADVVEDNTSGLATFLDEQNTVL